METHERRKCLPALLLFLLTVSAATASDDTTCETLECLTLSAEMTNMMNSSANPCNDFHNYACGNFPNVVRYNHANAHVEGKFGSDLFEDSFNLLLEKLERNLFDMLITDRTVNINDTDMDQLYNFTKLFFRSCGQWMAQSRSANDSYNEALSVKFFNDIYNHLMQLIDSTDTFESVLAGLIKSGGNGILWFRTVTASAADIPGAELNATQQATVSIRIFNKYYFCQESFGPVTRFFESRQIGKSLLLRNQAAKFSEIYRNLLSCTDSGDIGDREFRRSGCQVNSFYDHTISQLNEMSRCLQPDNPFSWSLFFEKLLDKPVSEKTIVEIWSVKELVAFANYFKKLPLYSDAEGQKKFNERVSFLIFDWLLGFSDFLPRQLKSWINGNIRSNSAPVTQGTYAKCATMTKQYLQPIVEKMYQQTYYTDSFEDVENIVNQVKNATIQSVNEQTWISDSAKDAIAAKINSMQHNIGFRKLTADQINEYYNQTLEALNSISLTSDLKDSFGSLFALAQRAYARKDFEIILETPLSLFMLVNPMDVSAFSSPRTNQVAFPMGLLTPRLYHNSYPDYIKLGSLGSIIGHEIGHAFDESGHGINRTGAYGHFWDKDTESSYNIRLRCVVKSYAKFRLYPNGPRLDSKSTVSSDMADIMGIKSAYGAMKLMKQTSWGGSWTKMPAVSSKFSPKQLFFIQAAQNLCLKAEPSAIDDRFGGRSISGHSPHSVRVNGMVQHTQEFADAFKCRVGDAMNPAEKCSFW